MLSKDKRFTAPSPAVEERAEEILRQLSLEEKTDLLGGDPHNGASKPNARAGIPALRMADGPVGVHWWCDKSTAYPATIALAASWDRKLAYKYGASLGRDCRARGVHVLLAPGINLYRSPLCGRNFEYLGEDPYLTSELVVRQIKGVQDQGVAATVKHYAANNQEYDRHGVSSDLDERTLREVYLRAFEAAVKRGGAGAIMTAYNLVNGQHCSEHDWLINQVLKGEWKFRGWVMSDWASTYSAAGAANGGLDIEMPTAQHLNRGKLLPAVESGVVTEAAIDDKIRRMLRLAICFGWLDHEQKDETIPWDDPKSRKTALDVERGGIVLLKNEDSLLPLDKKKIRKLAVIGCHAAEPVICGGGSAYTPPNRVVTLLEGLRQAAGKDVEITHAAGVHPLRDHVTYRESVFYTPEGKRGLRGEYFNNRELQGTPVLIRADEQINFPWYNKVPGEGVDIRNYSVRWTGEIRPETSGRYVFYLRASDGFYKLWADGKLVIDSGPTAIGGTNDVTIELEGGQAYPVRLEYIKDRDWNSVFFGWEKADNVKQDYDRALDAARKADAVIVCAGFTKESEGEGHDRPFRMPAGQDGLIRDVAAANPNTAVAIYAGGAVEMIRWLDKVKSLLYLWYPGQEGGTAAAEVIFGKVNPSGKLPAVFEKRLEDRAAHQYYHDEDGDKRVQYHEGVFTGQRGFGRGGIEPLFPFGFGLSYTTFAYENLRLSSKTLGKTGSLTVSFDVVNTGKRAGAEAVQLYLRDVEASVPRPVKELKGFAKVPLNPGQRKTVKMKISRRDLEYYDMDAKRWRAEPGAFEILIGASAVGIHLRDKFAYAE